MLVALAMLPSIKSFSQSANDTIVVQAFTFGSSQDSTIVFPDDTTRFEKILMRYKLRCPYSVQCGEWDYLTYTYAYAPTGIMDSVMHIAPSYVVNGASPDSFLYSNTPTYNYQTHFDKHIVYDSTLAFSSSIVGSGTFTSSAPFAGNNEASRSQYIWRASELTAAGLQAGDITGMRFYLSNQYGNLKDLTIRVKSATRDTITPDSYEKTGFTTVYQNSNNFNAAGWQTLSFLNSFYWDGISNVVIDISFTNTVTVNAMDAASDNVGYPAGITTAGNDRNLIFHGSDYVSVPVNAFANLDSFITVAFWSYGNPAYQPQNQSIFEGIDSAGHRVINCHLPWSNGSVYWDAGKDPSNNYDRIFKAATAPNYEGQWNHWAFTKNAATGSMRIYLNGTLFFVGSGKFKLLDGITTFKIGSNYAGVSNYDGNIDEFTIWNTDLAQATIQQWMNKSIDATHPYYTNLLYYYKFDDNSITTTTDALPGNNNATLFGHPQSVINDGASLHLNFTGTTMRPQVVFEQGTYNSHLDSVLMVDSTLSDAVTIVAYNNFAQPLIPTDTLLVWPLTYSYTYDSAGVATDSTLSNIDSTIYLTNTAYYDPPFEKTIRYELGRFITPYGNGLSLGNGFTWWYDVSDYRTILHDSLRILGGNWQELLDLQFLFIKGIPPRDPISVSNVWNGVYYLRASDSVETKGLYPKKVEMNPAASTYKFLMRPTGHGEDNNNCAEFCVNTHSLKVNGTTQFSHEVWKDNCGLNPLYPQGGTWVYERANWCPGDVVPTYDFELTPLVNPGDSSMLDYDVQPYISAGGSPANYVIESQVVAYGPINHTVDAAIELIKSPNTEDIYQRMNPICDNPVVTIKNNGSATLTNATINFGFEGGTMVTYSWTGNLAFDHSEDVTLPGLVWNGTSNRFKVFISNPNGALDEYHHNDTMYSAFSVPGSYPNYVVFELATNNQSIQNSYTLKDASGNNIIYRHNLINNWVYRDTVNLANGCYTFTLIDTVDATGVYGGDGLAWWANTAQGSGSMRIKDASTGALLKVFANDFGREIYQQFTCGYVLNVNDRDELADVNLYPNPSGGLFNLSMNFSKLNNVVVNIYDATGKLIYTKSEKNVMEKNLQLDLQNVPAGIYQATVQFNNGVINKRFVIEK